MLKQTPDVPEAEILSLLHAHTLNPSLPDDQLRAAPVHVWMRMALPMIKQLFPDAAYMLFHGLLGFGDAHGLAPAPAQVGDLIGDWDTSMKALYQAYLQYEPLHGRLTAAGCDVTLDRILD